MIAVSAFSLRFFTTESLLVVHETDLAGTATFVSSFAGAASTFGVGSGCFVGAGVGVGADSAGADFSLG